jgi:hypothetical protein
VRQAEVLHLHPLDVLNGVDVSGCRCGDRTPFGIALDAQILGDDERLPGEVDARAFRLRCRSCAAVAVWAPQPATAVRVWNALAAFQPAPAGAAP